MASRIGGWRAWAGLVLGAWLAAADRAYSQEPAAPPPDESKPEEPAKDAPAEHTTREVGGRLVIPPVAVTVMADVDDPPRSSSLATKIDIPLLETPRSVSIVDRKTLDEIHSINVIQAHDYTVGITPEDERGPGFSRGFRVDFYDLRRDGLRTFAWSVREPVGLDRIQYLRGPAAVLYGDGSPGGLVNLVLKKPLPVPRYEASLGGGELGFRRVTADVTGPLTAGRGARYRLVAAGEALENGFDNDESRISVLPMLSFELGRDVTLHLDGEYYDQRGRGYRHSVPATPAAQQGDFAALPWDLNMASPDDSWRGWNVSGGLRLDARLSPRVSLHVAGRFTKIDGDLGFQAFAALAPDGQTAMRFLYREKSVWDEYQLDTFVTYSARTGGLEHRVVAGFEAGLSEVDSQIGLAPAPSLDIYAPVYGPRPPDPPLRPSRNDLRRLGLYVQDQIAIGKKWIVVPALRWSQMRALDRVATSAPVSTESEVTPNLGLVFLPRPWLSLYATHGYAFQPPAPGQFLETGRPLEPVESRSTEGGVKADLLRGRLGATLAAYRIRQTQVAEADTRGFYRQIGEGESEGLEIEVVGSPVTGLVVRAGYAWMGTEITRDASGFVGRDLPNAPGQKADLWARYRFGGGRERNRFALAAGLVHVSERFTSRDNRVTIPAYTRFDATAFYQVLGPRLVLGLAAQNLGDTRYVTSGPGPAFFAGSPRRVSATLTTLF